MDTDKNNQESIDLSGRIKDSEVKPKEGQKLPVYVFRPGTPKIIQWLIKYSGGLIKNERQAAYILIGFVVLAIIVSLFLVFRGIGVKTQEIFAPPAEAPIKEVIPPAF
jgi:hypothetical protein